MQTAPTFDQIWEEHQAAGRHLARYPWDAVVTFVFRYAPRDRHRDSVRILEVGCGAAPNLWFAAREGFAVAGIDASPPAIEAAKARFAEDGLAGDLRVGDFTSLPFADRSFDLAIDRAALVCCGASAARLAVSEVARVLRPGGFFFFNPYAADHTSASSGEPGPDGLRLGVDRGAAVGIGQLCFYDRAMVDELFAVRWRLASVQHMTIVDDLDSSVHAEWRVVAERL